MDTQKVVKRAMYLTMHEDNELHITHRCPVNGTIL